MTPRSLLPPTATTSLTGTFLTGTLLAGALLTGTILLAPPPAHAYPISPQTLWEITDAAELVVVAEVLGVQPLPAPEEDFFGPDHKATLRVKEVWKGEAGRQVDVGYQRWLLCPAPARYEPGETVLAFLVREEEPPSWERGPAAGEQPPRWRTVALSYGSLYPTPSELPAFRKVVQGALELQADGEVSAADLRDWRVTAASHRGTRWHGLYGLRHSVDRRDLFYAPAPRARAETAEGGPATGDSEGRGSGSLDLTPEQLARIADGFVAEPAVDFTLPMLLAVLHGYDDPRVDETAVAALETALSRQEPPGWLPQAIDLVCRRFGETEPAARLDSVLDPSQEGDQVLNREDWDLAGLRADWARAAEELGMPRVEPLEVGEGQVRGTGGDTPAGKRVRARK